jgi:hypothetical protein
VPFTRISAERSRGKAKERGLPTPRLATNEQQLTRVQRGADRSNSVALRTCGGEELEGHGPTLFHQLRNRSGRRFRLMCRRLNNAAAIKVEAHRSGAELRHVVCHDHTRCTLLHQQCDDGASACGIEPGEWLVGDHESWRGDECAGDSRLCALTTTEARHIAFGRVAREAGGGDRRVGTRRKKFGAHAARLERERHII